MSSTFDYNSITPEIKKYSRMCIDNSSIDPELYTKYQVNRGLRDLQGNGVLTGLTEISEVQAYETTGDQKVPCDGKLFYRGISVESLVSGFIEKRRYGFEEATYLLLFGSLPTSTQLEEFCEVMAKYRRLPTTFVRDIIMKAPSSDMMNTLARCVLTLYGYDENPEDISIENVLRQSILLISLFPVMSAYAYQTYCHYKMGESLVIHNPREDLSTAENLLYILRNNSEYTRLEADILDLALVLHAEHGGGNNSTFTTHVVTSSGTDTYSAIAAALGSLKGPKHGGANIKVVSMFEDMKKHIKDWNSDEEVETYLKALLNKQAFDKAGLIYGMGHAVYSLSDPRAKVFEKYVERLSAEKGRSDEYALYAAVERLAPKVIAEERKIYKGVAANIDFYSGFVYSMLDLPKELFTPIFAMSRISGWSAHRIEALINSGKIIRPAFKSVLPRREYVDIDKR